MRDELTEALGVLRHARQTHVQWIDYLENENPDFDTEHVGDVEHHRWYLKGYDPAISALESYAEGRLPADFPTDEDVEAAASSVRGQIETLDHKASWSRQLARAALLAVAERRQG